MKHPPEILGIENVEDSIKKAIDKYSDLGMIIDMLFWGKAISLLKEKYQQINADLLEACKDILSILPSHPENRESIEKCYKAIAKAEGYVKIQTEGGE